MLSASDVVFLFDTDALNQVFITKQQAALNVLREDFGVRSFIMSEVEVELRSNKKLSGLVKPQLDKALKNNWLSILTSSHLDQLALLGGDPPTTLADIRQLGAEYNIDVQTGEAYTHAAGVLLNTPTVSNDFNAIRVLEERGKSLPPTVLRSFDLFGFLYLEKYLDAAEVEQIRSTLKANGEFLPQCMKNTGFVDGLAHMGCKVVHQFKYEQR